MQVLEFGHQLLLLSVFLTGAIFLLALFGIILKDRRLVVSARTGFYALLILVGGASACLIWGFVTGQYNNQYIYRYSERVLGTPFKVSGLWAGLDGSMLFWTLILCLYAAAAALQHRWSSRHPVGRRMEPYVYLLLSVVIAFFVLVTYKVANPFEEIPLATRLGHSPDGIVPDGRGLNPQLENYWMAIHPPALYLGLVGFTIPFAFSLAALLAGEMGDYWIKITRRWTLITWSFLTFGIVLGGIWAYEMLGWGGYWAWDPVENASILPWFVGTAFLHSVMVQERRDMLKGWNVFLIILTFLSTIVATYMTRSGVVSSVHAFAEGEIGNYFIPFMLGIVLVGAFIIGIRARFLRGRHQLESYYSREAAFFFNNLILIALTATIYLLSMFGKISHDFLLDKRTAREAVYNIVTTPLFLTLLLLTGLGPQLGWVKTSPTVLWKRIFWPAVAGMASCLVFLPYWWSRDTIPSPFGDGSIASAQMSSGPSSSSSLGGGGTGWLLVEKYHYYSTLLGIGLSVFIIATVWAELQRSVSARVRHRGETVGGAFINVVFGNNRRYGGYIIHVGIAILAIGVIWSSNFRFKDEMTLSRGVPAKVADSDYSVTWQETKELPKGKPYFGFAYSFDIYKGKKLISNLWPELRRYPKNRDMSLVSIPAISRNFFNDYYIHYSFENRQSSESKSTFTIFINPLVNWIWAGTALMLFGGLFAAMPVPRKRIGLVD